MLFTIMNKFGDTVSDIFLDMNWNALKGYYNAVEHDSSECLDPKLEEQLVPFLQSFLTYSPLSTKAQQLVGSKQVDLQEKFSKYHVLLLALSLGCKNSQVMSN